MADERLRVLRLFVSGNSASSQRAQHNLGRLIEDELPMGWRAEVIDVLADPGRAEQAGILATPTLSYDHQPRPRRIVGELGDRAKVLDFLGIDARSEER
jgi:circadian clock protein KaiB